MSSAPGGLSRALKGLFAKDNLPGTLGLLGTAFALLAILTPWFYLDNLQSGQHNPTRDYYLAEWVSRVPSGVRTTTPYDSTACACDSVEGAFVTVQLTLWSGALLAATAMWARSSGRLRDDFAVALTGVAAILVIAAPLLLALSLPGAFLRDGVNFSGASPAGRWGSSFVGSESQVATRLYSWGPGAAWFLSLAAAGLLLASVLQRKKKPVPAVAVAPAPWPVPTPAPTPTAPAAPPAPTGSGAPPAFRALPAPERPANGGSR